MPTFVKRDIGRWREPKYDATGKYICDEVKQTSVEFDTIEELTQLINPHFGLEILEDGTVMDGLCVGWIKQHER
jgi:hypothetical protein